MASRYEFRVFATRLARARDLLNRRASFVETEERTDTYFLGTEVERALKLRDDEAIDLKVLEAREGDYQLWRPAGKVRLPASGAEIVGQMPEAQLAALLPERRLDAAELKDILRDAGLGPAVIRKTRHRYEFDEALAEFTRIMVNGKLRMETAAIEAEAVAPLDALRARFGIGPVQNESYPEMLMRVLPQPERAAGANRLHRLR
jgi:adenylate cyclase class IV